MMWTRTNVLVTIIMVIAQINLGLVTISYKYLADRGNSLRVIVVYRMIFASMLYPPAIYVYERYLKSSSPVGEDRSPSLTWTSLGLIFLCGLFGGVVSYNLSVLGLELASTTTTTAISNLFPAITFIVAVIFRREGLSLHTWAGRAKVLGTLIAISGAMILSFYKGEIVIGSASQSPDPPLLPINKQPRAHKHQELFGVLAALGSSIFSAVSIIIEDKLLQIYPHPLRASGLIVALGALQCATFAAIMDHEKYKWRLDFTIQGVMAVIASGLMMVLTTWCISKKGSFFISIFSPITLAFVAIVSPFLLQEPLYGGSLIGAFVIFLGIYLVLWGKKDESADAATPEEGEEGEEEGILGEGEEEPQQSL